MNLSPMQKRKNITICIRICLPLLRKTLLIVLIKDLTVFRSEITELIEDEIISRYFYEDGAIAWTIKKDEQVIKALEILNNKMEYSSILKGKAGSILVTGKKDPNIVMRGYQDNRIKQEPV